MVWSYNHDSVSGRAASAIECFGTVVEQANRLSVAPYLGDEVVRHRESLVDGNMALDFSEP